ncbi:MAG: prepilin-type N-terminal cleavage/methylation domain-containing protein [Pseudomonadota bacterium]|nr:prepilin-type N-terminal cleavage/methylation domain-containing protein [Pseudomonadota bacterium]
MSVATRSDHGFTLLESMLALALLAICLALALPAYDSARQRVRRAEGKAALLRLMQQEQQIFAQRGSYVAFSATSGNPDQTGLRWFSGDTPASSAYEIEAVSCSGATLAQCVVLRAQAGTARVSRASRDSQCALLTLDSVGRTYPLVQGCW